MKKFLFLCLFLSATTFVFSQKNKDTFTDYSELKDFSKVQISLAANVHIRQADSFSCRIEGMQKYLNELEVRVKDSVLIVRRREKRDWFDDIERLNIVIEAPNFEKIDFSGAGQLFADNKLTGDKLRLDVSGAGSLRIDSIDYQHVDIDLSGVGNISIGGKAVSATMEMSGTGNIDAFDLAVETARCETSGVGNINCFASDTLNAHVSGIGGIRYKGTPKSLRKSVSGIGKVTHRN